MAMETLPVISDEEIQPTLHKGRPDAPMLGTTGMQELMDAHPNLNSHYIALLAEIVNRNLQNVLAKDNAEPYEPQGPYQPVTLHMLQEAVFNSGGGDMNTLDYDPTNQRRDIYAQATEAQRGMVSIATDAEAEAGTDGQKIMTPRTVRGVVDDAMERVVQVGDIVTTIRQLPDGQYVPCVGQELDADAYPETVGLQKTPVVFSLTSGAVTANSVLLLADGKGLAGTNVSPGFGRLYYTENYGESWATADTNSHTSGVVPLYLWANGKAIYSRNYYLYHTADFKGEGTETSLYIVDGACFLPDGHGVVSRGNAPEGLYYTSDYGVTWTRSNVTQRGACVIVPNGRGFARTTDGILYTTTNYGVLWSAIGSSADIYNSIVLKNDGHGLCLAGITMRYTIDYGATWTPCAGLQTSVASRFSLLDDGRGVAAQGSGATAKAYYTTDYGATWTPGFMETLANNETITAVKLAAFGGGFILTSAGTLYTVDFGRSWARLGGWTAPNVLLDNGRGIIGGSATCNFKVIAPNMPHGYMKVRSL